MKLNMRLQKIFFIICFLLSIAMFVYALVFMTDYQVLYGFQLPANKKIAEFYSGQLQVFNRNILHFGIIMIIGFGIMWFTRIKTEVCNFYTLVINNLIGLFVIVRSILNVFKLKDMTKTYLSLDYSKTYLEGLENYQTNTAMLDFGVVFHYIIIVSTVIFLAIMTINFFKYLSLNEGIKTYFQNLKKKSNRV